MSNLYELQPRFAALFQGLDYAFGTGQGRWIKRPLQPADWCRHLRGEGSGIGVAPLRPDNTVMFAAIDLDEPDFEAASEMQDYIPGTSFIERSRSGNAHVWVFFSEPCEAWLAQGILREATYIAGKDHVEVFPKNHDFTRVKLGNYINLPYHGSARPILGQVNGLPASLALEPFLDLAERYRNDPSVWRDDAKYKRLEPPEVRESNATFGTQPNLHVCADYVMDGEAGFVGEGHRNAVLFMLAKSLLNWRDIDDGEAWSMLVAANEDFFSPPEDEREVRRIFDNCRRAQYTSTGCDDPLVRPFTAPNCPILHG